MGRSRHRGLLLLLLRRDTADGRSALDFGCERGRNGGRWFPFGGRHGGGTSSDGRGCSHKRRRRGGHGCEVVALGFVHRVPVQFRLPRQVHVAFGGCLSAREKPPARALVEPHLGSFDVLDMLEVMLVVEAIAEQLAKVTERALERVGDGFLLRLRVNSFVRSRRVISERLGHRRGPGLRKIRAEGPYPTHLVERFTL